MGFFLFCSIIFCLSQALYDCVAFTINLSSSFISESIIDPYDLDLTNSIVCLINSINILSYENNR